MNDLTRILVSTDFSVPARQAVDRAARLAQAAGGQLSLVHVLPGSALLDLRHWLGSGHAVEQQLHADARQQLQRLAAELQAGGLQRVHTVNASGAVPDEIHRAAETAEADLLVVGARGAGFLRRLVMGSTSERLLRRTQRPLLVVRQPADRPYRRVLVALDFSAWSMHAVALAHRAVPQAQLVLFHAYQVPFEDKLRFAGVEPTTIDRYREQTRAEATQRLHALAAASQLKPGTWEPCLVEGEASYRLIEQEQERDVDLVVMGKHGQSATEDLLLGSVSKHVLAEGQADVLVSTVRSASP